MAQHKLTIIGIALTAGLLSACSSDNTLLGSALTTSSVDPAAQTKTAAAKIDPVCVQLATHIDALRKDGVVERVEQASAGKGKTVQVKRESLVKMAELQKANADFQAKCSTVPMATTQASSTAPAAPATQTAQATKPAKTASAVAKPAAPAATAAAAPAATTAAQGQP